MIKLFESLAVGIYAGRVANRLLDLGIRANLVGPGISEILYEIERDRRKEFNPREAAAYFFGGAFSNLPRDCYVMPLSKTDLAYRAGTLIGIWAKQRKMNLALADTVCRSIKDQLPLFELP